MEKELESKIFMLVDYNNKENMEEHIKEYIKKLRKDYPEAAITKEFYRGDGVFVRATQVNINVSTKENNFKKENELEKEEVRIKEKGISGLGENVHIKKLQGKSRGKELGYSSNSERERGGR